MENWMQVSSKSSSRQLGRRQDSNIRISDLSLERMFFSSSHIHTSFLTSHSISTMAVEYQVTSDFQHQVDPSLQNKSKTFPLRGAGGSQLYQAFVKIFPDHYNLLLLKSFSSNLLVPFQQYFSLEARDFWKWCYLLHDVNMMPMIIKSQRTISL